MTHAWGPKTAWELAARAPGPILEPVPVPVPVVAGAGTGEGRTLPRESDECAIQSPEPSIGHCSRSRRVARGSQSESRSAQCESAEWAGEGGVCCVRS
jgi:hypothetical protein